MNYFILDGCQNETQPIKKIRVNPRNPWTFLIKS